ncbi:MAG: hypothetical protein AAF500_13280 [Myxococcota bacterium]
MRIAVLQLPLYMALGTVLGATAPAAASEDYFGLGDGHHGAKVVSGVEVVNAYSRLAADVAVGEDTIDVADGSRFAAGDLVLVWQVNGQPVPASGDQTEIDLASGPVGQFEFARVEGVAANTLTLADSMVNPFAQVNSQVIFVPEFTDVTVGAADEIQAADWDPSLGEGGIVAFLATGMVTVDGRVTANGAGFLGGTDRGNSGANGCTGLDEPSPTGAEKGESIAGLDFLGGGPPGGTGRGNRANGGGGGVCHNSGGGGGGHGGLGGLGGRTWRGDPDPSIAGTGRDIGGLGGAALSYSALSRMTMGGGGGSGHQNNNVGGTGSDGGGVVWVRANAVSGAGTFEANGLDGGDSVGSRNDAAGGAGAGGLVVVRAVADVTCGGAQARGGDGGDALTDDHGTGGGASGGHTLVRGASVSCPVDVTGGIPGVQTDLTDPPGEHYGAQPGEDGDEEVTGGAVQTDRDGDGLLDIHEGLIDSDGDSLPDYLDSDDDGDGIPTSAEAPDLDGDGNPGDARDEDADLVPDYLDLDSDGDGIPDVRETGGVDANGDGRIDTCVDLDPADGLCDGVSLVNTDETLLGGDSVADVLDLDSDADGIPDADEAFDTNDDGSSDVPSSGNDHDGDGIDDAFDLDCNGVGDPAGCLVAGVALTDANVEDDDGDGVPNWAQSCGDGYQTALPSREPCDDGDGDDTNACNNQCRFNPGFGPCASVEDCAPAPGIVCGGVTLLCQFDDGGDAPCTESNQAFVCASRVCDESRGVCVACLEDLDCAAGDRCEDNACILATCGDGVVDAAEACDNGDDNGLPPESCAADCAFNVGADCVDDGDCTGDATCDEGVCSVPDPRTNDSDGDGVPDAVDGLSVQGGGGFGCRVGATRQGTPTSVSFLVLLALSLAIRRYQRS